MAGPGRGRVAQPPARPPGRDQAHPAGRLPALPGYLHCRGREITDALVDLLIVTVHRINAHAEKKVVKEFVETVSKVIYPAVPGGVDTLRALLAGYKSKGTSYRQHKQRVFKASCTNHYRRGLIELIEALEFGSANTAHAPVIEALGLIKRYKAEHTPHTQYYRRGEHVPVAGVVPAELAELMYQPCLSLAPTAHGSRRLGP